MSGVSGKARQLKYKMKHDLLLIENVVLVSAVAICLWLTYQSIVAMDRNWELTERLNMERKELQLMEIEVETAALENEYLQTAEYQELLARKLANKKLPGENMVVMPENSEAAKTKHAAVATTETGETEQYSNFEKWIMYLFPNR